MSCRENASAGRGGIWQAGNGPAADASGKATSGRKASQRPVLAAASAIKAIKSSAVTKGNGPCVPTSNASAATAANATGGTTTEASFCVQASAAARATNITRAVAAAHGGITLKRSVSSHSMGGRMTAAVVA